MMLELVGATLMMQSGFGTATPPVAAIRPEKTVLHGKTVVDNYAWLKNKKDPAVIDYLTAENAYAEARMAPTKDLQEKLYQEMIGRIKLADLSVPQPRGGYLYYTRTEEGKQYSIYCRKKGENGPEEILLDVNELAQGKPFMAIGEFEVSDDGTKLAYATDETGYRQYRLKVLDLKTRKHLPLEVERVTGAVWSTDGKTLFFGTEDEVTKRSDKIWRQALGESKPTLIWEEKDALYSTYLSRTLDKSYVLITNASSENNEVWTIPSDKPRNKPRLIVKRQGELEYDLAHREGTFYIRTNLGAKNFRIMTAPAASPGLRNWKEWVPTIAGGTVTGMSLFAGHAVLSVRENGLPGLRVIDLATKRSRPIPAEEVIYTMGASANAEFETTKFRYSYSSPLSPASTFELDLNSFESKLLKRQPVLGDFDPSLYTTERVWATAPDGTKVPIGLTYRKDMRQAGGNPLLLSGYGAYGISTSFGFSSGELSLLNRGVIVARAQIRGGSDMGEEWHDQGKMMAKRNSFTDFIACADHLVYEGYTTRSQLAISGGSAGGLLMGGVLNMRPDLCQAAMIYVPFVDVINTMLDETLPLTVGEFLEWGNPKIEAQYNYMRSYSPYENMRASAYPMLLVKTGLNDSQVLYHEPAKYVAKMRATAKPSLLILKTNMAAGHGGASGRFDALREVAHDYAFLLVALGVEVPGG